MTAQKFVLQLGRAMHALGSPAYRIEDTMAACTHALGQSGSFFATPTAIFAAIGPSGEERQTHLLRVIPGDHDLGRLAALYVIRDQVVAAKITPGEGLVAIREVLRAPQRTGAWVDVVAHVLVGCGAAILFGGGLREAAAAAGAGACVGLIGVCTRGRPALGDVQASLACAIVAFLVHVLAATVGGIHAPVVTVAAIVVLLPGLSFTTALAELAMRHLAAGSARLLGAGAVLLTMAIGIGIGDRAAELLTGLLPIVTIERLSWPWQVGGLLATWFAFQVLLRASRAQAMWVLIAVGVGYGGARLGGSLFGNELGAFVGALLVAALANLYARWRRKPAAVVRTPGLLLLVPGSLGFQGLTAALAGDFQDSAPFVFQMLLVGGAIVAGLLLAGVLVPPPLDVEPQSRGFDEFE